jgi:hypothetical protein
VSAGKGTSVECSLRCDEQQDVCLDGRGEWLLLCCFDRLSESGGASTTKWDGWLGIKNAMLEKMRDDETAKRDERKIDQGSVVSGEQAPMSQETSTAADGKRTCCIRSLLVVEVEVV